MKYDREKVCSQKVLGNEQRLHSQNVILEIYIVIHRQTVSLYYNHSMWVNT